MATICAGLNALLTGEVDAAMRQGADRVVIVRPPSVSGLCEKETKEPAASPPLPPPSRPASCVGEPE
eukprot:457199-Lingulodinium_polyedra.AAC.1